MKGIQSLSHLTKINSTRRELPCQAAGLGIDQARSVGLLPELPGRLRIRFEDPGLVCEHDRLDAIAEIQPLENVGDVPTDRRREAAAEECSDRERALTG